MPMVRLTRIDGVVFYLNTAVVETFQDNPEGITTIFLNGHPYDENEGEIPPSFAVKGFAPEIAALINDAERRSRAPGAAYGGVR